MSKPTIPESSRKRHPMVFYFSDEDYSAYGGAKSMRNEIKNWIRTKYPERP